MSDLSISFSGEASEGFADRINDMQDWYVRLTPQEGEPFDAVIVGGYGEIDGEGWYDAVRYQEADEYGLGHAQPQPHEIDTVRVTDVYIY